MELHTCLWNEVEAFDFKESDLAPLKARFPSLAIRQHSDAAEFLAVSKEADLLLTWDFPVEWYPRCPNLRAVLTPAAGDDWVEPDPHGRVRLIHGSFHGEILAESLLSAILFMNHKMPAMIHNFQQRDWDRNLQKDCRLLNRQTVLIIGLGNIGTTCARMLKAVGASVVGVRQNPAAGSSDVEVHGVEQLDKLLPAADHVVLLLPATPETDGILNTERLRRCKPGAFVYNFGRGNALTSSDLVAAWDNLGGAFLDVTDDEPLPPDSPLWSLENIMITPHASCVYDDYRRLFIQETISHLEALM